MKIRLLVILLLVVALLSGCENIGDDIPRGNNKI